MKIPHQNFKVIAIITLSLIIILSCKSKESEEFEGIIKFITHYYPHTEEVTSEQLISMYGDSSVVYMKNGNYKQIYPNSNYIEAVQYVNETNRYYTMIKHIDTLYYLDAGIGFFNYNIKEGSSEDTIIMGYNCKSIILTSEADTSTYYYTPKLPLDFTRFKDHKLAGYNLLTQKTKSVYLMHFGESFDYDYKTIAYEIVEEDLDEAIFKLPDYYLKKL